MKIHKESLKNLLEGNCTDYDIRIVFRWVATPQGYGFWHNERKNLTNGGELSHEALMYLTYLLLDHENVITES